MSDPDLAAIQAAERKRLGFDDAKPEPPKRVTLTVPCAKCGVPVAGESMVAGPWADALMALGRGRVWCAKCYAKAEADEQAEAAQRKIDSMRAIEADPAGALAACGVQPAWQAASLERCPDLPKSVVGDVRRWARKPVGFLFLSGPPGCGKTWLAAGALLEAFRVGCATPAGSACVCERSLLDEVRRSYDDAKPGVRVDPGRFARLPLLLLDDLGASRLTDWGKDVVAGLIETRHARMLPTIVTSNFSLDEIGRNIDPRTSSRLVDGGVAHAMPAVDLRAKKRKG